MWSSTASVLLLCILHYVNAQTEKACGRDQPEIMQISTSGVLYSPGFLKGQYPDNVVCQYQLHAPWGMKIRLKFNVLDIDATDSCSADQLDVYQFNDQGQGVLIGRHCGNQAPNDYLTRSNIVHLRFQSDEFANRKGFNITYTVTDKPLCPLTQFTCKNRKCVESSGKCNGNDDCGDGSDEEKCGYVPVTAACGRPEVSPKSLTTFDRIVGGDAVVPGSWPWMVSMQQRLVEPNGQVCGGSLISAQWVLAAAHCFGDLRRPGDWRIHMGIHKKFEKDPYEQIRLVERIIIYDDLPTSQFEEDGEYDLVNDVALVKLNAPVKFSKFVKPVCLPDLSAKLNSSSRCFATGWGLTRGSGHSDVLKQAYHPIQNDNICTNLVRSQFVPATMICAGSTGDKNGVCHGDSGGPLACEIDKVWSIFGVASYVTDSNLIFGLCGLKDRPSVFNKIIPKLSWISKMMNKYS